VQGKRKRARRRRAKRDNSPNKKRLFDLPYCSRRLFIESGFGEADQSASPGRDERIPGPMIVC